MNQKGKDYEKEFLEPEEDTVEVETVQSSCRPIIPTKMIIYLLVTVFILLVIFFNTNILDFSTNSGLENFDINPFDNPYNPFDDWFPWGHP